MNETKANMQQQATQLNNQAAQLRNLEVQLGQMENLLTERHLGSLPSNSKVNPRRDGNKHVKAVTLRSDKELEAQEQPPVIELVENEKVIQPSQNDHADKEQPQEKQSAGNTTEARDNPPIPYPQRLKKHKLDKKFTKFMEVFKKLHINIPFADALEPRTKISVFSADISPKYRFSVSLEKKNAQKFRLSDFSRKFPIFSENSDFSPINSDFSPINSDISPKISDFSTVFSFCYFASKISKNCFWWDSNPPKMPGSGTLQPPSH